MNGYRSFIYNFPKSRNNSMPYNGYVDKWQHSIALAASEKYKGKRMYRIYWAPIRGLRLRE